jgi:large conductance mechanosensitive channel
VIGLGVGGIDFSNDFILLKDGPKSPPPYHSLIDARAAGAVTMNYGSFINTVLTFLIVAASVYMVVKAVTKLYPTPVAPVNKKDCPYCKMNIPLAATRCPDCTSQLAQG